jgi:hypothetical protein
MEDLFNRLDNLENKVKVLLAKYNLLKEENEFLKTKISQLTKEEQKQETRTTKDSENQENGISSNGIQIKKSPAELKRIKKEIEQAVKHIDECIDWIQKY